jgi:hypothetical protein
MRWRAFGAEPPPSAPGRGETVEIRCWRCGVELAADLLPLRHVDVCPACNADLRVCKLCIFYNPSVSDGCDEPIAASVTNKERANYCDYFKPCARAFKAAASGAESRARAELDALFGGGASASPSTDADRNRSELERLFGIDKQ